MTLSLLRRGDAPLRIGHRGAPVLAPENTLASFERALELGMDGVELDVVCTGAERLVVCHDADGTGPNLDEALEFLSARDGAIIQLDAKIVGREALLVDALRRFDLLDRTVVSSVRPRSLRAIAALEPRLARSLTFPEDRLGLSSRTWPAALIQGGHPALRGILPRIVGTLLARAQASGLTLHFTLASEAVVAACHARGAAVWLWNINDPETVARGAAFGADAIISDDPRIFRVGASVRTLT